MNMNLANPYPKRFPFTRLVSCTAVLWATIGMGAGIYAAVTLHHPDFGEGLIIPPTVQWPSEPGVVNFIGVVAEVTWLALTAPLLVLGLLAVRRRSSRQLVRSIAWFVSWSTGLLLMVLAGQLVVTGRAKNSQILVVGELTIAIAWLALGVLMILLLEWSSSQSLKGRRVNAASVPSSEMHGYQR